MAVYRVHKTENYTVMCNEHLRDSELSLKAKGLLSVMLSLPESWDYSIGGLCAICKEGARSIKSALDELKESGYLVVVKKMANETESGRIEYEYNVFETKNAIIEGKKLPIQNVAVENVAVENVAVENAYKLNTYRLNNNNIINNFEEEEEIRARAREAFQKFFNRSPNEAELKTIVNAFRGQGMDELLEESIGRAAKYGARSPAPYICSLAEDWRLNGVKDIGSLVEFDLKKEEI